MTESQSDFQTVADERSFPPLREMDSRIERFFGRDTLAGRLRDTEFQRENQLQILRTIDRTIQGTKAITPLQIGVQLFLRNVTRPRTVENIRRLEIEIDNLRGELGLGPVVFPAIPAPPPVDLVPLPARRRPL